MATTPRRNLPLPIGTDMINQGDNIISGMSSTLDAVAMFNQGALTARPASSKLGDFYYATDTAELFFGLGPGWVRVMPAAGDSPVGTVADYAGTGDPTGGNWLLCDGRALSRVTFAALFAAIGTAYGTGDGTDTFNIPDCRSRVTIGPDTMGTGAGAAGRTTLARGATGGGATVTLAITNLPMHTHGPGTLGTDTVAAHSHTTGTYAVASHTHGAGTLAAAAHTHGVGTLAVAAAAATTTYVYLTSNAGATNWGTHGAPSGADGQVFYSNTVTPHTHGITGATASVGPTVTGTTAATAPGMTGSSAAGGAHTHAVTTGATAAVGSGTPVDNLPPYIVANKIIRVT